MNYIKQADNFSFVSLFLNKRDLFTNNFVCNFYVHIGDN